MAAFSTADEIRHVSIPGSVEISDEQLTLLQQKLKEMFTDISDAADKAGVRIILGGGSALGAVRNGGIIPWDDDIDLMVTRDSLDKLLLSIEENYGSKYWIRTPGKTEGYNLLFTQIRMKGTSVRNRDDHGNSECGLPVDIFVIEDTYDNPVRRWWHGVGCMYFGFAVSCRKFYRDRAFLTKFAKDSGSRKLVFVTALKKAVGFLYSGRSLDRMVARGDRWYSKCRSESSRFITIPTGRLHFFGETYKRDPYLTLSEVTFEGVKAYVPGGTSDYLHNLYGNYEDIPAEKEREHHIYFEPFEL
ncbi:MAG: LicD family protein [Clostridiales bacterium]|nr:LicD family protein [Clostridiales bacterium]